MLFLRIACSWLFCVIVPCNQVMHGAQHAFDRAGSVAVGKVLGSPFGSKGKGQCVICGKKAKETVFIGKLY